MPWLEILSFGGKQFVSVLYDDPHVRINKEWREVRYIEITNEQAALPLDVLRHSYKAHQVKEEKTHKKAHLLQQVIDIIKTSHHAGERANAKDLYKQVVGEEYKGPEYQAP
jgi:hypothetical protein